MSNAAAAAPPKAPRVGTPRGPAGWLEAVMIGAAGLTPVVAYLSNVSFAVVVALAGLLCLPAALRQRKPMLGLAALLALALWALASMNWSIFRQAIDPTSISVEDLTALKMLLELGLYGAFVSAALGLSQASAARATQVLCIGLLLLTLLFVGESISGARLYFWIRAQVGQPTEIDLAQRDVARVAFALALLFWPVAIWLEGRKAAWAAAIIAAAIVVCGIRLGADAPAAALAVSAVVYALVRRLGRRAVWACIAGVAIYFICAPLVVSAALSPTVGQTIAADPERLSWAIRLDIWRFSADRILERPFFGWGLDASRMFSPQIQLHTHNAALQLWLELGAVGACLAALFWMWLFGRIDRIEALDRPMAATAAATASVYLTIGALSFGVWQEWWVALGAVATVACIMALLARRGRAAAPTGSGA